MAVSAQQLPWLVKAELAVDGKTDKVSRTRLPSYQAYTRHLGSQEALSPLPATFTTTARKNVFADDVEDVGAPLSGISPSWLHAIMQQ